MKKVLSILAASAAVSMTMLSGCSRTVSPGDIEGYDEGEQYISLWVHIIEDTPEGQAYLKSVNSFNEHYNGKYFADVEFIPRNDSGGGYSDKVNASVLSGNLTSGGFGTRPYEVGVGAAVHAQRAGEPGPCFQSPRRTPHLFTLTSPPFPTKKPRHPLRMPG